MQSSIYFTNFLSSFAVCFHRVICLCAQFEVVLQHGLRKSRGLALTAAAIKHAAGFSSKTEAGTVTDSIKLQTLFSVIQLLTSNIIQCMILRKNMLKISVFLSIYSVNTLSYLMSLS